ncbi:MAG: amidohydrolase family protein, partial [Steroidobacteraceae bacterium]
PHETAVAVGHLIFGGVIERFPSIRFCVAHGGGTVAALLGRWQHGFATARPGVDLKLVPPASVVRRLAVDCLVHHSGAAALAADVFGLDQVVFGSDWPFPMGLLNPHEQLGGLPSTLRQSIFAKRPDDLAPVSFPTTSSR